MATPAEAPPNRTGSCLCGKVTLRIAGQPVSKMMCHCTSCQKASGSVCMTNMFYRAMDVTYSDPESLIRVYVDTSPDSGGSLERSFCGACGSSVCITNTEDLTKGFLAVPWGVIAGDKTGDELRPTAEIFVRNRPPWFLGVENSRKAVNQYLDGRDL